MVHKFEHGNIAPVVVVVARANKMQSFATVVANVGNGNTFRNGRKPSKVVLLPVAKKDTARL